MPEQDDYSCFRILPLLRICRCPDLFGTGLKSRRVKRKLFRRKSV